MSKTIKTPVGRFISNKLLALKPRMPNRVVIGAIDSALNRVDAELRKCADPHPLYQAKIAVLEAGLREEQEALREARSFIIEKRKGL